ncbi:hypothetical protein N799_12690 [Lysobacter arseniciresistens ZS79]|uniref:Uncharacterized protein n=1 Tax=Lysobacter arseniciresistens ZS79 TaxID=913325 RepID=A0A0A0F1K3_9GAMM|nr:hypothetical protein [Lysobacter arseniciresistens]KGM57046.1 hypothetical protein N799_12690 [Lysobacter arseniciresistens ZS79]
MSQNITDFSLDDTQLAASEQAMTDLETNLSGMVAMSTAQRRKLARMGDKSEAFCRQTLAVLAQNPQVVPPSLKLAEAQADLEALDRLRPLVLRLQRLAERATDTEIALGSDVMRCALDGYALLKVSGRNQGLEGLRKELGTRFARTARNSEGTPEPA